jgi:myo-inositol-1(or 4)-monophosphatase
MGRVPSPDVPEAATGKPAAPRAPIDWLALCRRVVSAHRDIFAGHAGIAARSSYEGIGKGGDHALVIDRLCEAAVFVELDGLAAAGHSLTAISEERGEVSVGSGQSELLVVIDPIDGSLNARRTLPSHSLSIAIASGPTMADIEFGYVYDFGAGEEFTAERDRGARLGEGELRAADGDQGVEGSRELEIVGLEAAEPGLVLPIIAALEGKAYRLRAIGSIAISLCYVAAGRFDGMLSTRPCRSVDAAAAQLIAREAGASIAFGEEPLSDARLDLGARYRVAAAREPGQLATLLAAQGQGGL